MSTLDEVLQVQKDSNILQAPTTSSSSKVVSFSTLTDSTLSVALVNNTSSSDVYAYVTGLAVDDDDAVYLLESDGSTVYYPTSPTDTGTALSKDCGIKLGAPGSTTTITVPRTAGGRIWFCKDATLTFLLNPGPALVEPSVTNTSDDNYDLSWDFCEFTFNTAELFINITYVDFTCLPIALQLENTSGTVTTVEGLPSDGLDTVCSELTSQTASDGAGWSSLIVKTSSGGNLRALSPNSGIAMDSSLFDGYYQSYVDDVWSKYTGSDLQVDTQASYGTVSGSVDTSTSELTFSDVGSFAQPAAADIFSCSTGAFAVSGAEMANIAARLAAAFNRSTLLIDSLQPDDEVVSTYYTNSITNHYARILHATNLDGKGYAFPYDDVGPSDGVDQSGSLYDANPKLLTVTVGGPSSSSSSSSSATSTTRAVRLGEHAVRQGQRPGGFKPAQIRRVRRSLNGTSAEDENDDEKKDPAGPDPGPRGSDGDTESARRDESGGGDDGGVDSDVDLEKGLDIRGKQETFYALPGEKDPVLLHTPLPGGSDGLRGGGKGGGNKGEKTWSSSSSLMSRPLTSPVAPALAGRVTSALERLEASPSCAKMKPAVGFVVGLVRAVLSMSARALVSRLTMALVLVFFYLAAPAIRAHAGVTAGAGADAGEYVGSPAAAAAAAIAAGGGGRGEGRGGTATGPILVDVVNTTSSVLYRN